LDPEKELEKRLGGNLTEAERRHLLERIASAREWVANFASEEEKTRLQEELPQRAESLSAAQRAFLHQLAVKLNGTPWEDDALQAAVFEIARMTPIDQPQAFKAIYRVLLDRESGPKAGNLLAFLNQDFVIKRFQELAFETVDYWKQTAVSEEDLLKFVDKEKENVVERSHSIQAEGAVFSSEYLFTMADGKRLLRRLLVEGTPPPPSGLLA
jgi:lysyl-tRNA synthetase class 1